MSIEARMDRLWKETYPHRNPHQWTDESLILASVFAAEMEKLRGEVRQLRKELQQESA